jgi:hypothetical protein
MRLTGQTARGARAWHYRGAPGSCHADPEHRVALALATPRAGRGGTSMHADLVVGGRFPDLELPDHRGQAVRLSALAVEYPLILSFYRGYW